MDISKCIRYRANLNLLWPLLLSIFLTTAFPSQVLSTGLSPGTTKSCLEFFQGSHIRSNSLDIYLGSEESQIDRNYISNAIEMHDNERIWYRSIKARKNQPTFEDFKEFLLAQHKILAVGQSGENNFINPGSGGFKFNSKFTGYLEFRNGTIPLKYIFRQSNSREGTSVEEVVNFMKDSPAKKYTSVFSYGGGLFSPDSFMPRSSAIVEVAAVKDSDIHNIAHTYPLDFEPYLKKMYEVYLKIALLPSNVDTKVHKLELIAQYYYYAIRSHAFDRMNLSHFTIQINALLEEHGWSGNFHRALDVYATSLTFDDFLPFFLKWFNQANSNRTGSGRTF